MDEVSLEDLRMKYIPCLRAGVLYMDHAGATLPRSDMIVNIMEEVLTSGISWGNPHTNSIFGRKTEDMINHSRSLVLDFFDAKSDEYEVIFVANATAAMKLVTEAFPWTSESMLCYPMNSHTSLLASRCFAPNVVCVSSETFHHRKITDDPQKDPFNQEISSPESYSLLLVPGECNFSGRKADVQIPGHLCQRPDFMDEALSSGTIVKGSAFSSHRTKWLWFLDAAKLASTSKISLRELPSALRPDFMAVSFYKIFGYPTGIGALLIKKSAAILLQKRFYGGGTVQAIAASSEFLVGRSSVDDIGRLFEDGTPNYHGISGMINKVLVSLYYPIVVALALKQGFSTIKAMGGMMAIQEHTYQLAHNFAIRLNQLYHNTSKHALSVIYGNLTSSDCNSSIQGSIVAFNLYWSDGSMIGFSEVAKMAEDNNVILRTGCFCNPGGCQETLGISADDVERNHSSGRVCGEDAADIVNGRPTGSIRVSFGFSSIQADVDKLLQLLSQYLDKAHPSLTLPQITQSVCDNLPRSEKDSSSSLILKKIYVYPIKSCGGYLVPSDIAWKISSKGLYLDRRYAVADSRSNRILTQKSCALLAQVVVDIDLHSARIRLSHPSMLEFVTFAIEDDECTGGESGYTTSDKITVRLCGRQQEAIQRENFREVDAWFNQLLQLESGCHLVTVNDTESTFVNEAQLLLISEESVIALSDLMKSYINGGASINRISDANFRPNIVTSGGTHQPHQEDGWKALQIEASTSKSGIEISSAAITWKVIGPCSRCSAINMNATGAIDGRVFQTVGQYRKQGNRINFGQFLAWDTDYCQVAYIRTNSIIKITPS